MFLIPVAYAIALPKRSSVAPDVLAIGNFEALGMSWERSVSVGGTLDTTTDGGITFEAPEHGRAHVQREAGQDLITVSEKVSRWASLYLVWNGDSWCGVGQVSPTPFGRIFSTTVVKGTADEADHRGIIFGTPRWLRIRLGENFIRFEYSADGAKWGELRTVERPKDLSGAPKFIAAGKYYVADDNPFAGTDQPVHGTAGDSKLRGQIFELQVATTPREELRLSDAEMRALHQPKVDPVMAVLNEDNEDPTFEKILKFHPPMKYPREVVGVPWHPLDIGVDYLGRINVSPWEAPTAWFEIGDPPVALGREGSPFKRRLAGGYIPIDILTTSLDGLQYELTIFGWSEEFSVAKPLFAYARLSAHLGRKPPQQISLVSPGGKLHTWRLVPNRKGDTTLCIRLQYPNPETAVKIRNHDFATRLSETRAFWEQKLAPVKRFDLPDARVMEAYRAWFAYSMLNTDSINGYLEPHDGAGFYEEMFGNSVSLHTMVLDEYGLHDYAARVLETQMHFQQANGLYTQACGLTDPGAFLVGLVEHYRITGDRQWLQQVSPNIIKQVEWLLRQREAAPKEGVLRGLIKFRPYNDYPDPAFNYLGDSWCALGMEYAAEALKEIGSPLAEKYAMEAAKYRKDILDSMKAAAFEYQGQMLLPMEPETHRLLKLEKYRSGGYYGLTLSPLLATGFLSPDDERTNWLVDAFETRGGLVAGLAEFEEGVDHAYTYGYLLTALKRGEVRKTLLGFWSMLAFGMTRDTYSPVEVTMIETGENHLTLPHLYSCTEQLQLLRTLLLREDGDVLQIGEGIPRAWLERGKHVAVTSTPTEFGTVSYRMDAEPDGNVRVRVVPPSRRAPREIRVHLRNPEHRTILSVRATPPVKVSSSGDTVALRDVASPVTLDVRFVQ